MAAEWRKLAALSEADRLVAANSNLNWSRPVEERRTDRLFYLEKAKACDASAADRRASRQHRDAFRQAAKMWREMAQQSAVEDAMTRAADDDPEAP